MLVEVFVWSCWVNAALSAAMAAVSLLSRPTSRVKTLWGATCLAIAAWAMGIASSTNSEAIPAARISKTAVNVAPPAEPRRA